MINAVGKYLINVISVCGICGMVSGLVSEKKPTGEVIKLLSGVLLILTVISPLKNFDFSNLVIPVMDIQEEAQKAAFIGIEEYDRSICERIETEVQTNIEDQAQIMGLSLTVEAQIGNKNDKQIEKIYLSGEISAYKKNVLIDYITNQFGVPEEQIIWN